MTSTFRRSEVISGAFVLGTLAIFTVFAFRVEGLDLFGFMRGQQVLCRSYFADTLGLEDGAKVTVAGKRIGTVHSIRIVLVPQGADEVRSLQERDATAFATMQAGWLRQVIEVDFAIEDPTLHIDLETARVTVAQDGLLGRQYLNLEPGFWQPGAAPQPIVARNLPQPLTIVAREVAGLDQLFRAAESVIARADGFLGRIEQEVLSSDNLDKTREMLSDLAITAKAAKSLLDSNNSAGLQQSLVAPLQATLAGANELIAQNRPTIRRLLDNLSRATTDLEPQLHTLLANLNEATAQLEPRLARVETDVHAMLTTSKATIDENRAELAETMRSMRRAMWQAEMMLRKIRGNPSLLLFGDEQLDQQEQATDFTELDTSGRVRPFRQRDEQAAGGK